MTTINDSHNQVGSKIRLAHLPWPQECQNQNSMESKVEGTTTLDDLHHPTGSKIGPAHFRWPQERQNKNFMESKVRENMTICNVAACLPLCWSVMIMDYLQHKAYNLHVLI